MVSWLHVITAELVLIRKQFIGLSANHTSCKCNSLTLSWYLSFFSLELFSSASYSHYPYSAFKGPARQQKTNEPWCVCVCVRTGTLYFFFISLSISSQKQRDLEMVDERPLACNPAVSDSWPTFSEEQEGTWGLTDWWFIEGNKWEGKYRAIGV